MVICASSVWHKNEASLQHSKLNLYNSFPAPFSLASSVNSFSIGEPVFNLKVSSSIVLLLLISSKLELQIAWQNGFVVTAALNLIFSFSLCFKDKISLSASNFITISFPTRKLMNKSIFAPNIISRIITIMDNGINTSFFFNDLCMEYKSFYHLRNLSICFLALSLFFWCSLSILFIFSIVICFNSPDNNLPDL